MNKTFLVAGIVTLLGFTAVNAQEESNTIDFTISTDTAYSLETEAILNETTLGVGAMGLDLSAEIQFNVDETSYEGVTLGAEYGVNVVGLTIAPYAEYSMDGDSEHVDTVVGLKASKTFGF